MYYCCTYIQCSMHSNSAALILVFMLLFRSSWARRTYDIAVVVSYGVLRNTLVGNTQQLRTYVQWHWPVLCVQHSSLLAAFSAFRQASDRGTRGRERFDCHSGTLGDWSGWPASCPCTYSNIWQNKTSKLSYITTYLVLYCCRSIFNPLY